jgi:hypothetical protein
MQQISFNSFSGYYSEFLITQGFLVFSKMAPPWMLMTDGYIEICTDLEEQSYSEE